ISLTQCALPNEHNGIVAVHHGQRITQRQFSAEVAALAQALQIQTDRRYALYYEAAYPFAVMLFALLHADKQAWIAANNLAASADKLVAEGCQLLGEWQGRELVLALPETPAPVLHPLNLTTAQLVVFTSGSSGQAKAIVKTLQQLH